MNYVYGTGFPDPSLLPDPAVYNTIYSRLDGAIVYEYSHKKFHIDAGVSILNFLNRENIKYSNYTRVPSDETSSINLYAEAVPFTPTLFLKIYY
jgi:hypothetical protein